MSLPAVADCKRCAGGLKGEPDAWLPEGVSFGVLYWELWGVPAVVAADNEHLHYR